MSLRLPNTMDGAEILASGLRKVEADVVIIGSGCGGATVAAELTARGRSVVILEAGGLYDRSDLDQRELHSLAKIDGARGLDASANRSVQLSYGNNVGGASVHYGANSYRLPEARLQFWIDAYGMQGHGPELLNPLYERIERDLNVHPAPDQLANRMNVLVRDAATALGWRVSRVLQARKGCASSGYCHQGCSYDAKQSMLVTYLPRALGAGARLYADCRAILLDWRGRDVTSVTAQVLDRASGRPTGETLAVETRAVVVAAGGYGTPSFLLTQGMRDHLHHTGEHLFCNPSPMTLARFDEEIVLWRNIPAAWRVDEFLDARHDPAISGEATGFFGQQGQYLEGGYPIVAQQLQPALLAALAPGVGVSHRRLMRQLPRLGGAVSWIDDAEEGRITWDGYQRRVNVPLTGGNAARIRDAWKKQARLLFQAGAQEVVFCDADHTWIKHHTQIDAAVDAIQLRPGRNVLLAPHPGGGARMGSNPLDSVVGYDHRVHNTDNLFVADPSVFPTAPGVDPSLSIMAFAMIAAGHVEAGL